MKNKKSHRSEHQQPQRHPTPHKNPSFPHKPSQKSNKQNLIQITESFQSSSNTYPSKQFILSRQSLIHPNKTAMRELSTNKNHSRPPKAQNAPTPNNESSNQLFDRRLSLKYTGNYSQQLDYQKSQRLSMAAPLRRQSLGQTHAPQSMLDERQSMSSMYQNSLVSSDSKSKLSTRKEAIMTNLMHKLDHEEDLRSIIELKLKNGINTSQMSNNQLRQKKNSSYITDFTEENPNHLMASKLEQCQTEITYFKSVIRQMSQKICQLTEDQKFKRKHDLRDSPAKYPSAKTGADSDLLSLLRKISPSCHKCEQKESRTVSTQVDPSHLRHQQNSNSPCDFLDNLQKTIKVLDGKQ